VYPRYSGGPEGSIPELRAAQVQPHPALSFYTLLTAQFIHGDAVHLIGNMVFLFAFGRAMEALLGGVPFALALLGIGPFAFLGRSERASSSSNFN
jgi:membrane associated rhomboid family serine protease